MTDVDDRGPIIGYVVGPQDDARTVCADCHRSDEGGARIRDNGHYGDEVPYPECRHCGRVIRPENIDDVQGGDSDG